MKDRLLDLINKVDKIEKLFHWTESNDPRVFSVQSDVIYDVQEFRIWMQELKCELQEIYGRTHNKFIWDTINDISANFNGWNDRTMFNKVKGDLIAIKNNIESYYPQSNKSILQAGEKVEHKEMKAPKIFISHSSKDIDYVAKIVALLDDMGLDDSQVFCSSMPGYDIPLDMDIFSYLRDLFQGFNLHVIFIHSANYYDSVVSMNEMGAAWVLRNKYTSILLPGFDFTGMKGVVDNKTISIKLDNSEAEVKDKLNQFYEQIIQEFGIRKKKDIIWEQKRDAFIQHIKAVPLSEKCKAPLSYEAWQLLNEAANTNHAQILVVHNLTSGKCIQVNSKSYSESMGIREFSKWDAALEELVTLGYIKALGKKGEVFQVTNAGFKHIEENSSRRD